MKEIANQKTLQDMGTAPVEWTQNQAFERKCFKAITSSTRGKNDELFGRIFGEKEFVQAHKFTKEELDKLVYNGGKKRPTEYKGASRKEMDHLWLMQPKMVQTNTGLKDTDLGPLGEKGYIDPALIRHQCMELKHQLSTGNFQTATIVVGTPGPGWNAYFEKEDKKQKEAGRANLAYDVVVVTAHGTELGTFNLAQNDLIALWTNVASHIRSKGTVLMMSCWGAAFGYQMQQFFQQGKSYLDEVQKKWKSRMEERT